MKFIIWQPWGGLGDNLQFSTLPEQLSKQGHSVYLHRLNACRSQEIFDIAWSHNPWLKGITNDHPNCGWIGIDHKTPKFGINKWEALYGAPLSEGLPKIYFDPQLLTGLENVVLVDLNFTSCPHYEKSTMPVVYSEIEKRWPNNPKFQIKFTNTVSAHRLESSYPPIEVTSLMHYCSMIASCKAIVTLLSGASPLAAAIKKFRTTPEILTIKKWHYDEGQIFPNADFVDEIK